MSGRCRTCGRSDADAGKGPLGVLATGLFFAVIAVCAAAGFFFATKGLGNDPFWDAQSRKRITYDFTRLLSSLVSNFRRTIA